MQAPQAFRASAVPAGVRVDDAADQWTTAVIDRLVDAIADDDTETLLDDVSLAAHASRFGGVEKRAALVRKVVDAVREWSDDPTHIVITDGTTIAEFCGEYADAYRETIARRMAAAS